MTDGCDGEEMKTCAWGIPHANEGDKTARLYDKPRVRRLIGRGQVFRSTRCVPCMQNCLDE